MKLVINNFKKQYQNNIVTIKNLDITKKITIVLGENGSGKSTLLKAIANLITFQGTIKGSYHPCYLAEHPNYPLGITVFEFLKSLSEIDKRETSSIERYLIMFNMKEKQYTQIKYLSKGMLQKLNIIQCLNQEKDLFLLDEPYSGLDKLSVKVLNNHIDKSQAMFIISTHQIIHNSFTNKEIIILE